MWAWENPEQVPGATCTCRSAETGTTWLKKSGDLECLAVSGGYLWRAMVIGPPDGTVLYITAHRFQSPTEAMRDAERWVQVSGP